MSDFYLPLQKMNLNRIHKKLVVRVSTSLDLTSSCHPERSRRVFISQIPIITDLYPVSFLV